MFPQMKARHDETTIRVGSILHTKGKRTKVEKILIIVINMICAFACSVISSTGKKGHLKMSPKISF